MRNSVRRLFVAGAGVALLVGGAAPVAGASTTSLYVSPDGSSGNPDGSCATAGYSDINAAVAAAASGATVVVCAGTYDTEVLVDKPLTLMGQGAVIDATGQAPPLPGLPGGVGVFVGSTSDVRVTGLAVRDAGFDGVLVADSRYVRVDHDVLTDNGDVGVDLNGSWYSTADHDVSLHDTGGGFLLADDLGTDAYNTVEDSVAALNPGGCGVIIAGHSVAGVWGNTVRGNDLHGNGSAASPGAGVVIATEVPNETVADNTVIGNVITGNGISGVTLHAHSPSIHMGGNRIIGNDIGTNNLYGDPIGLAPPAVDVPDMDTTGILVGSSSPLQVTITGNLIHDDHYGVWLEGLVAASVSANVYHSVTTDLISAP